MANFFSSFRFVGPLRTTAVLTNNYVVFKTFSTGAEKSVVNDSTHLVLFYDYTKGASDSLELKIEHSFDGINWFAETSEAISSGVGTVSHKNLTTATAGKATYTAPTIAPYIRISAKVTGTVTSSDLVVTGAFISKY
jgi:hypothetical protein